MHHDGTISGLLNRLKTNRPSSPRLIWYGPDQERVELSGRVLENWVAKTANFLVDELDAGPDSVVQLDMDPHWRSLCWALACWQSGATLCLATGETGADMTGADMTVTADPRNGLEGIVVAVALGALQMSWPGQLPAGVLDYAGEIRGFDDVFVAMDSPDPDTPALRTAGSSPAGSSSGDVPVSYAALLDGFAIDAAPDANVLVEAAAPMRRILAYALGVWRAGGTLVLAHPDVPVSEALLAAERVTDRP